MGFLADHFSIYVIPPLLSIIVGWTLALISVVKGKFRQENIFFSLVCIWWTLMPVIYISHHLFRGDTDLILRIERSIHFFYVYMPFIIFLYLRKSFEYENRFLLIFSLFQSIIISVFVPTGYYISGLYTYSWGYTAIGGVAFKIFGLSAMFYLFYFIYFFVKRIKGVSGASEILKLKYILASFIATGILMILNMPSISGIDFYAFGNFMFIPLLLIAYGVLRYRLMDIRSVIHLTLVWLVLSSLIIIPNIYIYIFLKPWLFGAGDIEIFLILALWFFSNYYYFVKVKPLIDRLFDRQKFNLLKSEALFIENISLLKTVEELATQFSIALKRDLNFKKADLFFKRVGEPLLVNISGKELHIDPSLHEWFITAESFIDRELVEELPEYREVSRHLLYLFDSMRCSFILPFVYSNELNGIAFIGERTNARSISKNEIRYMQSIRNAISISISNSAMYQKLSDLKDSLEEKVIERTEDMLVAMQKVEEINRELSDKNSELSDARSIADMDMMMAVNVQKSIFPVTPDDDQWDVAAYIRPMSGVSGDLYDFYVQDDALKGAVLLDVSGHGVASGLITMIARSVFYRNFFSEGSLCTGSIMESVNSELIREIGNSEKYLTGILVRLDNEAVEYVNAGHPDILIKRKSGGGVSITGNAPEEGKGSILGVAGLEQNFREFRFQTDSGDILLAFSDGILEAMNPDGEAFGYRNLMRSFESANADTAQGILDQVLADFDEFTAGRKVNDDITVIVLRKK
ncbi:MAG TPA: PP2C family protein-serine/threonine phosphatase [Spirochaetota bacterium]|nr:PP2C family protein-serine/threonine phosphatase [Spirochaetota bacterium]